MVVVIVVVECFHSLLAFLVVFVFVNVVFKIVIFVVIVFVVVVDAPRVGISSKFKNVQQTTRAAKHGNLQWCHNTQELQDLL